MSQNSFQELITKPKRPKFRESFLLIGKKSYIIITSSLLALIFAILSWVIPSPPLKVFFHWSLLILVLLFVVIFIVSTVIYTIRLFRYISSLEKRIHLFRKIILVSSGIDNIESDTELKYHISGIADQQGTVNLLIDLSERNGLRPGSLLDVVVSATGEIWGYVEVSRIIDKQAWAFPKDRRNSEFWGSIEDRMKRDPSPPAGIHLEPLLPEVIRQLLSPKESSER